MEETRQPTPGHYHRNGCTAQGETRATGNKPGNQIFVLATSRQFSFRPSASLHPIAPAPGQLRTLRRRPRLLLKSQRHVRLQLALDQPKLPLQPLPPLPQLRTPVRR